MKRNRKARLSTSLLALAYAAALFPLSARAASYLPLSDADLVRSAPVIVRAEVTDRTVRLDRDGDRDLPFRVVTLRALEIYKGTLEETFRVVIPGGIVGDFAWAVPGAPEFEEGHEVVLMLNPLPERFGEYGLSEFGLSKFDLVSDETGRAFAVRPVFDPWEDLEMSKRQPPRALKAAGPGEAVPARDAESFLSALRAIGDGKPLREVLYALPASDLRRPRAGLRKQWSNLGGVEPGNCGGQACLFRWFWDNAASPDATAFVTGTQTNLVNDYPSCGTDQTCLLQNAVANWRNVPNTDVRLSGPSATGNFEFRLDLDVAHNGTSWTTPYACDQGGVIGIGGPTAQGGPRTFKGLNPYFACNRATISMRRWTCPYNATVFLQTATHEAGHALGLHHPDQFRSVHSTTTAAQWDAAIMWSRGRNPALTVPQADDIQGIQFYYGTTPPGTAPAANFSFSPSLPTAGSPAAFSDTSTNSPTGWIWTFGEPSSASNISRDRNPTHTYAAPGTYTVELIAGNLNGGSRVTKQVTVGGAGVACVPNATTLCLAGGRFQVRTQYETPGGQSGAGMAIPQTSDTGLFWFFSPTNIEMVLKVLNTCVINSRYWVFAGGLTDVKVTMTVTDTSNGTVKTYVNPLGTPFAPIQDTNAFATCP